MEEDKEGTKDIPRRSEPSLLHMTSPEEGCQTKGRPMKMKGREMVAEEEGDQSLKVWVTGNRSWSGGCSRLEVVIIKLLGFNFWSNEGNTIFLLLSFIEILRVGRNWRRRRRSLRYGVTHGGREASHIIM